MRVIRYNGRGMSLRLEIVELMYVVSDRVDKVLQRFVNVKGIVYHLQ